MVTWCQHMRTRSKVVWDGRDIRIPWSAIYWRLDSSVILGDSRTHECLCLWMKRRGVYGCGCKSDFKPERMHDVAGLSQSKLKTPSSLPVFMVPQHRSNTHTHYSMRFLPTEPWKTLQEKPTSVTQRWSWGLWAKRIGMRTESPHKRRCVKCSL